MTEMTRQNPFDELMSLREAMNQLLTDSVVRPRGGLIQGGQTPLDLYETEQEYVAKLALPGLKPDDFEITLQDNVLRVRGQTSSEEQTEQARYHVREHRFGSFDRVIQFPSAVNGDQVEANLAEGILTIRVPKSEAAKPKRIHVSAGA
jgi:HSP20 family protein